MTVTYRVLGFSTQANYRWLADPVSRRDQDDAHLLDAIIDVHRDEPEFGYPFIADEGHRLGHTASENRVQRLCALQKVAFSIIKRRRGSGKQPGPAVSDNRAQRNFTANRPDEVWLTDITEHGTGTGTGKVYVCAVKDVFSRGIAGWSIGHRMTVELVDTALRMAIVRRRPSGTAIVPSDRGGQFR